MISFLASAYHTDWYQQHCLVREADRCIQIATPNQNTNDKSQLLGLLTAVDGKYNAQLT